MEPTATVIGPAPNTNYLQIIGEPENANLDIVAVHGMNVDGSDNHSENAWTDKESRVNWLKDLLPETLPRARILAYQYNANIIFRTSVAGIEEQARNLLHFLDSERKGQQAVRPIIFIAHSMGGILVKEALATAFHDRHYSMIWIFTYGIVFFAVPHKGSKHATWGRTATQITQLFTGDYNESFLDSVEESSEYNIHLNNRFSPLLDAFKFFSIRETVKEPIGLIVQLDSASLDLPDSQEVKLCPNRTHRTICKFASSEEPEWQQFSRILVLGAACATNFTAYSPIISERQMKERHLDGEVIRADLCSIDEAIEQTQLTLTIGENLLRELHKEEDLIRDEIWGQISWLLPILTLLGYLTGGVIFAILPILSIFLPTATTILGRAERTRQSQEQMVEFQKQALVRLDSHRANLLAVTNRLQLLGVHGKLPPNRPLFPSTMEYKLSQQLMLIIREQERRQQAIPEEIRRLEKIEQGQREAQGMDNRQLLEMIGRRAEEERDILEANQDNLEDKSHKICPYCVIL